MDSNLFIIIVIGLICLLLTSYLVASLLFDILRFNRFKLINKGRREFLSEDELSDKFPSGLRSIHTFAAGEFICEDCGQNTYFSLISLDPDEIDLEEIGLDEDELPELIIIYPNVVQCSYCGKCFGIKDLSKGEGVLEDET